MENNNIIPAAPTHDTAHEPASRAAAERIAPEMAAMLEQELDTISVDVSAAVARVMSAWDALQPYLPAIARIEGVDGARVAKLHDYALNLIYWQGSATYASPATDALARLIEQGMAQRDRALADLGALANHGILDGATLANFRGSSGHRKLGQDLIGLSNLVHDRWAAIEGRSMITLASMDDAMRLGEAILKAVGDRDNAAVTTAQALTQRTKAFTLFARAYDEARRAVLFLRWHEGDADAILPSMYAGRRTSKKRESEADGKPAPTTPQVISSAMTSSLLVDGDAEDEDDAVA